MSEPTATATITPITRKSRASRSADQNLGVKAEVKVTATPRTRKSATPKAPQPKVVVKKVATPKTPSLRAARSELGSGLIKVMADYASKCKLPAGLDRDEALKIVSGWASYLPGQMDGRLVATAAGGRRTMA
jgi:hypothetical protein